MLLAASGMSLSAQTGSVVKFESAHRMEVTKALDKHPDAAIHRLLAPYKSGVDSIMAPVLGQSELEMTADWPESTLSNWICDVLRHESRRYGKECEIGLANIGGLRSAMPKGNVRVGDIMEIAPFENRFCILTMRGSDLLELFEQIAKQLGQGISGAQLNISKDGKLLSATVGGKAVKPKSLYRIATIDYLAEGNDGLTALKKAVKKDVKKDFVRDVYMEFIRKEAQAGRTLSAQIEGRVTIDGKRANEIEKTTADKKQTTKLLVVQTSDTHSCIEPVNPNSSDKNRANKGGYLRRAVLLEDLRETEPELLLVDDGDFSQGSAYYNLYKGEVEVKLMNYMRYDVATIGNHEFDFGIDNMVRIFRMADFPIVCCNYDFSATPLKDVVKPYVIIEKKGLRIGVTGVCPMLEGLVSVHNCEGITYNDPIASAQPIADRLKNEEHCDMVIVLSHLGYTQPLNGGITDGDFITGMRNIDAVFGGHSHTYFKEPKFYQSADGKQVPLNHMGKNAQFVGTMWFEVEK